MHNIHTKDAGVATMVKISIQKILNEQLCQKTICFEVSLWFYSLPCT